MVMCFVYIDFVVFSVFMSVVHEYGIVRRLGICIVEAVGVVFSEYVRLQGICYIKRGYDDNIHHTSTEKYR